MSITIHNSTRLSLNNSHQETKSQMNVERYIIIPVFLPIPATSSLVMSPNECVARN